MIHGTPEDLFFDKNGAFRYITEVAALIELYGEERAGRYMWAIWLVHHPASEIFELEPEDKIEWVKLTYLKEPDFEWPGEQAVLTKPPKKKPAKRGRPKKKGLDDDFDDEEIEEDNFTIDIDLDDKKFKGFKDGDLMFVETGVHLAFVDVIKIFPRIAMSIEERSYYGLVRLRDIAMYRSEFLNGKDLAAAIRQIAGANSDLDKMKSQYLTWKEDGGGKSSGDIQSGWGSTHKR